jgi:hypothetical protein
VKWRKKRKEERQLRTPTCAESRNDEGKLGDWLLQARWLEIGHEREYAEGLRRIGRIFRAGRAGFVGVIVDLPENFSGTRHVERAEIVFAVRIVSSVKSSKSATSAQMDICVSGGSAAIPAVHTMCPGTARGTIHGT